MNIVRTSAFAIARFVRRFGGHGREEMTSSGPARVDHWRERVTQRILSTIQYSYMASKRQ